MIDLKKIDKKILFVMPRSAGDVFLATSLLQDLKETYPEYALFFATSPQFFSILEDNPYIDYVVEYQKEMDNLIAMEGQMMHEGFFDICFLPCVGTQMIFDYQHNGLDKINFDLRLH